MIACLAVSAMASNTVNKPDNDSGLFLPLKRQPLKNWQLNKYNLQETSPYLTIDVALLQRCLHCHQINFFFT